MEQGAVRAGGSEAGGAGRPTRESHPSLFRLAAELGKPLAFFDLETTTNSPHKETFGITEFAYLAIMPDGSSKGFATKMNPENPVDEAAARITGIDPAELVNHRPFPARQELIRSMMEKTLLLGFNINTFDIPGLLRQFERYGLAPPTSYGSVDIREIWTTRMKTQKGRLSEVASHYGKPFDGAHRAMADTMACADILEAMLWAHGRDGVMALARLDGELVNKDAAKEAGAGSSKGRAKDPSELTPAQLKMREFIDKMPESMPVDEFISQLTEQGFVLEVTKGGAAYNHGTERFGGSTLGPGYSWRHVVSRIAGEIPAEFVRADAEGRGAARSEPQEQPRSQAPGP